MATISRARMPHRHEEPTAGAASQPIQVRLETTAVEELRTGVVVVGAFDDGTLPVWNARRLDTRSKGRLSAAIKAGDLERPAGSTLLLHDVPGVAAKRVLL